MTATIETPSFAGRQHEAGPSCPITNANEANNGHINSWGNINTMERLASLAGGTILTYLGLNRRGMISVLTTGIGGGLLYRGVSGTCPAYSALGIDTTNRTDEEKLADRAIHVTQSFLIDRSAKELYDFWRNFENLPRIMTHLESVQVLDDRRSRWKAQAPWVAGSEVEWDAEITEDQPNSLIAWRSLPGSDIDHRGSVQFVRALGDRGTNVRVVMDYAPPTGQIGRWVAKWLGEAPEQQIREDLRRFKRIMETGEVPTTDGQPHGTCSGVRPSPGR